MTKIKFDEIQFIELVKKGETLTSISKIMDMDLSNINRNYKRIFKGISFEDLKKQLLKKEKEDVLENIVLILSYINFKIDLIIKGNKNNE